MAEEFAKLKHNRYQAHSRHIRIPDPFYGGSGVSNVPPFLVRVSSACGERASGPTAEQEWPGTHASPLPVTVFNWLRTKDKETA